jgi:hypothetical protein
MEVAQQLQSKQTNYGTKTNYRSKIKIMSSWMQENFPEHLDDNGDIIIPYNFSDLSVQQHLIWTEQKMMREEYNQCQYPVLKDIEALL